MQGLARRNGSRVARLAAEQRLRAGDAGGTQEDHAGVEQVCTSIQRRCRAHHGATLARAAHPAIRIGGVIRRDFNMVLEHRQDRAHKRHLSESLRNPIGHEISWLEGLWIKVEFERAFLTRLTYAFQDALRMLVSSTLTHVTTDTAFSHALGTMPGMGMAGGRRLTLQNRAKQIPQFVKMPLG